MLTLPNILTLSRMVLLPLITALFFLEGHFGPAVTWIIFALYALCALTDFLDGWLARKLNQISDLGTFLDPISDKIFVATLLILLVNFERLDGIWIVPVLLILAREFFVSGLREFLGPHNIKLPVTKSAKWKTTLQMLALGLLILAPAVDFTLGLGRIALCGAAILTLTTGWAYGKAGLRALTAA